MKQFILLFGFVFLFASAFATHVDENTAKRAGQNFLTGSTGSSLLQRTTDLKLVYKSLSNSAGSTAFSQQNVLFYVFNADPNGFVIVAGDDAVFPILGYSDESSFDPVSIPSNFKKWLEGYKDQIRYIIDNDIVATTDVQQEWNRYATGSGVPILKNGKGVNPLVQTKWNQAPYYNALCPGNSVTGCVATAMAQIMKFWNFPEMGTGFHSYNHSNYGTISANFASTTYEWSSMPNQVSGSNNAVATLMFHCGVGVDMDYSPSSSGAYVISAQSPVENCSEFALKTYFGYKTTLQGVQRVNYNETSWVNLLKGELDAGRPILYAGFGSGGGHAFVCDGYDNSGYFHFNWGWGGTYDGYFSINALNPDGTGIGGGTGGFNSGHQAIIGIEAPDDGGGGGGGGGAEFYDLALYGYLYPSESTISYGSSFSISTAIGNYDTETFTGDFCAAAFDSDYEFVDFVEIVEGYTLDAGYYTDLVFESDGLLSMLPGTCYIATFYRPSDGNWVQVSDNDNLGYYNLIQMEVVNQNDIELYSEMIISPGTTLIRGQSATINLDIVNNSSYTFVGKYAVDLYGLDGYWVETIYEISENEGLPPGYHYAYPYLTFTTNAIGVAPGTYLLAVTHKWSGYDWELTGSSYYQNPVYVTVQAEAIEPDPYENNNEVAQAYALPVSFSGNTADQNTQGANLHIETDYDYYRINLPTEYNYTITTRLHDSYDSGNGNVYTVDALFAYSMNGTDWSDAYDDVMPGNIAINGGGTLYFTVAPYFAGETGTYLLDMSITRVASGGIADGDQADLIRVYPNPAKNIVNIDLSAFKDELNQIDVYDMSGHQVLSCPVSDRVNFYTLPVLQMPDGVYYLRLQFLHGTLTKKITI
ncbi:MAG: thiol protease/hemagglutinin PrtT, partial [Bacteroidales bacterium]|nr:thiol protease/hemagglutinin PrtT [Bacteroidales bacterium]